MCIRDSEDRAEQHPAAGDAREGRPEVLLGAVYELIFEAASVGSPTGVHDDAGVVGQVEDGGGHGPGASARLYRRRELLATCWRALGQHVLEFLRRELLA